jgi:hypothetical protein
MGKSKAAEHEGEGTGETARHRGRARVWSREQRLRGVLRGRRQLVAFVIQMNDGPTKRIVYILGLGIKILGLIARRSSVPSSVSEQRASKIPPTKITKGHHCLCFVLPRLQAAR